MEPDNDNTRSLVILTKGTMVSHYRIIEMIGAGGMGEVYLAEDTKLNRNVALKFLPSHLCRDEDCRERFKREAQAAAGLDHPNIVTVYEVGEHQGRPFFSMQHIEGQSLREYTQEKRLDFDEIVNLIIQICDGLGVAHDNKIIHRDIKPTNILVDAYGRPKILDFGVAVIQGGKQITASGSTLGTVGYMSPEQVAGKTIDHRSDLFSLGVVLYALIAGKAPFVEDNEAAILKAISEKTPEPLARFKADTPGELQRIVTKLLEKDPELRYQSAAGVISDLKRLLIRDKSDDTVSRKDWWNRYIVPASVLILIIIIGYWFLSTQNAKRSDDSLSGRKMLAVLPFDNLGAPEDEYFADGITDEITTRLARVHGLGVIARTSAMRFKGTSKSIQQIGKELGVEYILEGTVRWQGTSDTDSRVRVTPQLIRVSDESHLWAEIYDELLVEVFTVQTSIAEEVVAALNVTLLDTERRAIQAQPTANLEAYNYFLRGREIWMQWEAGYEDLDRAISLMEKAVSLDTTFADAYAELSGIHSWYYETGYDRSDERIQLARQTATLASRYDSLDAYSHGAWGYYYYYIQKDFNRALEEFQTAREKLPNNSEVFAATGYVLRRLGRWEESYEHQKRAYKLNPLNFWILYGLIDHSLYMRYWSDARLYLNQAMSLFPDLATAYHDLALLYLLETGDYDKALQVLDSAPQNIKQSFLILDMKIRCLYFAGDYEKALQTTKELQRVLTSPADTANYFYRIAELNRLLNLKVVSVAYYDSAKVYVESLYMGGRARTAALGPSLGQIYAGLGEKEKAIEAALRDVESIPITEDALTGMERITQLAQTYVMVGEYEQAINLVDTLLSIPSDLSVAWLQGYPHWAPLHNHPRFQAMMEKYEKEHGN